MSSCPLCAQKWGLTRFTADAAGVGHTPVRGSAGTPNLTRVPAVQATSPHH